MNSPENSEANYSAPNSKGMWVDTHCHLQLDGRDPVELMNRATDVAWMVVPGVDLESSRAAIELAAEHPTRLKPTVGLHPHDAEHWPTQQAGLIDLMADAAAVGETGLDYYRNLAPKQDQRASFADHIELAREHGLPIVVHCRDAFSDVYEMLGEAGLG